MRKYNKKRKPKHWTKPKWKTVTKLEDKTKIHKLITRGMRNKHTKDRKECDPYIGNSPEFNLVSLHIFFEYEGYKKHMEQQRKNSKQRKKKKGEVENGSYRSKS